MWLGLTDFHFQNPFCILGMRLNNSKWIIFQVLLIFLCICLYVFWLMCVKRKCMLLFMSPWIVLQFIYSPLVIDFWGRISSCIWDSYFCTWAGKGKCQGFRCLHLPLSWGYWPMWLPSLFTVCLNNKKPSPQYCGTISSNHLAISPTYVNRLLNLGLDWFAITSLVL